VAVHTGVVDDTIAGAPAPWRQASVLDPGNSLAVFGGRVAPSGGPVAVVTVSDLHRSRAAFLDERYEVLGAFERETDARGVVTDETRGYKPLTHIWPLVIRDGRVHTLIAATQQFSQPLTDNLYTYLAVGPAETELLFICRLRWIPGAFHGLLDRVDLNGDGFEDLVVYPGQDRNAKPIATFTWDPRSRRFVADVTQGAAGIVSWWSTAPEDRVVVSRDQPVDAAIKRLESRLSARR